MAGVRPPRNPSWVPALPGWGRVFGAPTKGKAQRAARARPAPSSRISRQSSGTGLGALPGAGGATETSRGYAGLGQPPAARGAVERGRSRRLGAGRERVPGRGPPSSGGSRTDGLCPLQPLPLQGKQAGRGSRASQPPLCPHSEGARSPSPAKAAFPPRPKPYLHRGLRQPPLNAPEATSEPGSISSPAAERAGPPPGLFMALGGAVDAAGPTQVTLTCPAA